MTEAFRNTDGVSLTMKTGSQSYRYSYDSALRHFANQACHRILGKHFFLASLWIRIPKKQFARVGSGAADLGFQLLQSMMTPID